MSDFIPTPKRADPAPDIDPTLPSWARGILAVFTNSRVMNFLGQVMVIVTMLVGGNHLDNKINDKHADTNAKIAEVEKNQTVTHEKVDALKSDMRKGP